jgi:hypothetical protein
MKKYSVLWSGGLDSTFMIEYLLSLDYQVDAYYVELMNNEQKTRNELVAIDKLQQIPSFQNPLFKFHGTIYKGLIKVSSRHNPTLPQSQVFLEGLALASPAEKGRRAAMGYVMNDCAISYIPEIKKYWKAKSEMFIDGLAPLKFPLMHDPKDGILMAISDEAKPLVHWCENEDTVYPEICGTCNPCAKMLQLGHGADRVNKVRFARKMKEKDNGTV